MNESLGSKDLSSFFTDKQLCLYIQEQITQACFELHQITAYYIVLSYRFNASFNPNLEDHVQFIITLGKGFPMTAPQVHIASTFVSPSLRSYGDYLRIILGGNWMITSKLKQITLSLPLFILKLQKEDDYVGFAQKNCHFYPSKAYNYSLLKELSDYGPFIAFETGEEDQVKLYIVAITSSHILLFRPKKQPIFKNNKLVIPKEKQIEEMSIQFAGEIQSLLEITHLREEKNEYTFTFVGQQKKNEEVRVYHKKLKITKPTQMLSIIIKSFRSFKGNIDFRCGEEKNRTEEVQLLKELKLREHKLKNKFNKSTIIELNKTYQKLVELYSSMGLPYEEVYLRKVAALFNRQDVKLIMEQEPSPTKSHNSESPDSSPSKSPIKLEHRERAETS